MPQFKLNNQARVFFYLDITSGVTSNIVLKKADSGSTNFETLTYSTNYSCIGMNGGWYACNISGNILDTIGETLLEFSYSGSNSYYNSIDVVTNLSSDITSLIGTPIAFDGGTASIAGNLIKMVDNSNGSTFTSANDSLKVISSSVSAMGPVATTAISGIVNTGQVISGYWDRTTQLNNVYWQMRCSGVGQPINIESWYSAGTGKIPNSIRVYGRYQVAGTTAGKYIDIFAWNYPTSGWDQISSSATRIQGQTATTDNLYNYNLTDSNTDTLGNFKVKFVSSDTTNTSNLYLDYVPYYYQTTATTASEIANAVYLKMKNTVYGDTVYIDTNSGIAGTSIGYDGIYSNPVNNMTDALIIAHTINIKRFNFSSLSNVILSGQYLGWNFDGNEYHIDLGGQILDDCRFNYAHITGTGLISDINEDIHFDRCYLDALTITRSFARDCTLTDGITITSGNHIWYGCFDGTSSTSIPIVTFQPGAELQCRNYRGGIQINNMVTGNDLIIDGFGRVIIDSSCTGGSVTIRGSFSLTNNGTNITLTDNARYNIDLIVNSGNANNWGSSSSTGYATPSDINSGVQLLFASGQINWNKNGLATEVNATINKNELTNTINSGVTINQIIASGTAAGWNATGILDLTGIATTTDVNNARDLLFTSGQVYWNSTNTALQSTLNTVSGNINSLHNISVNDILASTIDTQSLSGLLTSLLAFRGKSTKSGDSYTYYKSDGITPAFTLTISSTTRTVS